VEKSLKVFPLRGKKWAFGPEFFHSVENFFPQRGKNGARGCGFFHSVENPRCRNSSGKNRKGRYLYPPPGGGVI
jgi:hypothetical protein